MIERAHPSGQIDPETARRRLEYDRARIAHAGERDDLTQRWNLFGNLRVVAFLGAVALVFAGLQTGALVWFLASIGLGVAFAVLIAKHRTLGRARARAVAMHDINREALLRNDRDWDELPLRNPSPATPGHAFANDLDLFGHASLFHLLETVETAMGVETLRSWLDAPSNPEGVGSRQAAVMDVAREHAWRLELATRGRLIGAKRPDPEPLLQWAESPAWTPNHRGVRALAIAGPVVFGACAVLAIAGFLPWVACVFAAALNIVVTQVLGAEARPRIALVAEHFRSISQYAQLIEHIETMPGSAPRLAALRDRTTVQGQRASHLLDDLSGRAAFAVPPGSIVYFGLQAALAWDVNVLARLERWQQLAGHHVRDWLAVIGEVEALSALATLAYDNPTWSMPTLAEGQDRVVAKAMGHPLLPDNARVTNDIELGPTGTFMLVTGSNMSGKSTLLRSIGVNVVLASAGGPVCAASFACPPVRLWTSVRVEDSLERGVSFFMAELQRLKKIVDASSRDEPGDRRLLYLLDEILQGTNTAERQIAARKIIRHLVDAGALGAVSTHDLTLADGPELSEIAQAVHLRDTVTATGMAFDYKLRPGVATSTNALRLMDIVFGGEVSGTPSPN